MATKIYAVRVGELSQTIFDVVASMISQNVFATWFIPMKGAFGVRAWVDVCWFVAAMIEARLDGLVNR